MKIDGHDGIVKFEFLFKGMMLIIYMGEPIAIIDEDGKVVMRDDNYPIYLIEYLIENMNMHCFWMN